MAKPKKNILLSHHVLGVTFENWLIWFMVLVVFSLVFIFYFMKFYEYSTPPETEKIVVKIEQMWTEGPTQWGDVFFYVRLKQDGKEEQVCRVMDRGLFLRLQPEQTYEFLISRSKTKCFVSEAVKTQQ